jgi:K+-transporting ATPase ATPase C chain
MLKHLRPAFCVLAFMTLLCGGLYPLLVTALAQLGFSEQANGSQVYDRSGALLGSRLLAQPVSGAQWFQARPSAAGYATVPSGASNLAPSNPALAARIAETAAQWQGSPEQPVPMQLVTTSASGLDPELSPQAAAYQIPRIAAVRHIPEADLQRLLEQHTQRPLMGPPVVNVLALNQALAQNRATLRTENPQ